MGWRSLQHPEVFILQLFDWMITKFSLLSWISGFAFLLLSAILVITGRLTKILTSIYLVVNLTFKSHNFKILCIHQETNKTKTREELLAEERDYKRRRMSYRGKKGKKTAVQVKSRC